MSEASTYPSSRRHFMPAKLQRQYVHHHDAVPLAGYRGKLSYVRRVGTILRARLEAAVVRIRGTLSIKDAALIQSIVKTEKSCMMTEQVIREHYDTMTPAEAVTNAERIVRFTMMRDKMIDRLLPEGLDSGLVDAARSEGDRPDLDPPADVPVGDDADDEDADDGADDDAF